MIKCRKLFIVILIISGLSCADPSNASSDMLSLPAFIQEAVLQAPLNLGYGLSGNMLTINWNPVDGATGYKIGLGMQSGSYTGTYDSGALTQTGPFDVSGVSGTYYLSVKAYNGAQESSYSNEILITLGQPLQSPQNFSYTLSSNMLTVSWDAVNGSDGYKVAIGQKTGDYSLGVYDMGNVVTAGPMDMTGVTGAYYLAVMAYNSVMQSEYSNEIFISFGIGSSTTIGSGGGTIDTEGIKVVFPSEAVSGSTSVTITKTDTSDNYDSGSIVSAAYTIELDSDDIFEPIRIETEKTGETSGDTYAFLLTDSFVASESGAESLGSLYEAQESGNQLSATIPASVVQGTSGSVADTSVRRVAGTSKRTFTVWFASGYDTLQSEHFKTRYSMKNCSPAVIEEHLNNVENAFSRLTEAGFPLSRVNFWPMSMDVIPLSAGEKARFGKMAYAFDLTPYFALNESFCKDSADSAAKIAAGHEFSFFLQRIYDPHWTYNKARNLSWLKGTGKEFFWLLKASSVWLESQMAGDDNYVSENFKENMDFYINGLEQGGKTSPRAHGYGASGFLRYLTSLYGKSIIHSIWQKAKAQISDTSRYSSTTAIYDALSSAGGSLRTDWKDFAEKFLTGTTGFTGWPVPATNAVLEYADMQRSGEFTVALYPLSASKYSLNFLNLMENKKYRIEITEGKGSDITAVAYKNRSRLSEFTDSYEFVARPKDTFTLIVINNNTVFPYNSLRDIKLKIAEYIE